MHVHSSSRSLRDKINIWLQQHQLKRYDSKLRDIRRLGTESRSDAWLLDRSRSLMEQARDGVPLDGLLVEAYALVAETAKRLFGYGPFDVQLVAGMALHDGKLVEMQTGEGKTLAAVFPAYLNALPGKGVHVLTFNDYLADRDAEWMGPIYRFLGLSVGHIGEGMSLRERRAAYAADITYVTAKEAGFDYLKDALVYDPAELVHRPFHMAIADEADSVLIDEARVPLVIAGESDDATDTGDSRKLAAVVEGLTPGEHYDTDEYKRNVYLTEAGADRVEALLGCGNLYDADNTPLLTALHCALHAEALVRRDVDYIVRDGKVELIDEFTGRIADNRHWPDGLQAAVAAKEELAPQTGGTVLGTITLQHLLSLYPAICGMTATALSSADEFRRTYDLDVVVVPSNRPCRRVDRPPLVFTHKEAKMKAMIRDIASVHAMGRPILIGTASVEESDELAGELKLAGIPCHVLNAANDKLEASIIAEAGKLGAVTVSTNMAGRGVDIKLGGGCADEYAKVAGLGGLYVIGAHVHESVRIDNQLKGRAGRQGDPGSSVCYVSLEDDLLVRFGLEAAIPESYRQRRQDEPIGDAAIAKIVAHIQRVVDGQNADIRRTQNKYADMVEQQRRIFHGQRQDVLLERTPLTRCSNAAPERYAAWLGLIGLPALDKAERRLTLVQMDRCWADYLDYVAYIREGIHLESISSKDPLEEYLKRIIAAFDELPRRLDGRIVQAFLSVPLSPDGFAPEREEVRAPSSTWTYIVNDRFFQNKVSI